MGETPMLRTDANDPRHRRGRLHLASNFVRMLLERGDAEKHDLKLIAAG